MSTVSDEELKYYDPRYAVLIVPLRPMDDESPPWIVVKCTWCSFRVWFHTDSGANRLECASLIGHIPVCNAEASQRGEKAPAF